jgi:hypothetical protein
MERFFTPGFFKFLIVFALIIATSFAVLIFSAGSVAPEDSLTTPSSAVE